MPPSNRPPDEQVPSVVLLAVALLALIFLSGGIFLNFLGVFKTPLDVELAVFPATSVMVSPYQGPLWGMKPVLEKTEQLFKDRSLLYRDAVAIYPDSALRLRPIAVDCQLGFVAAFSLPPESLPPGFQWVNLTSRPCVRVRISGWGKYSGMRAFRAAQRRLGRNSHRLLEGERFEIWTHVQGRPCVEHWLPIKPD